MNRKELTIWMGGHALVLFLFFSFLFLPDRSSQLKIELPHLPKTIGLSPFGSWFARNMWAVSADQWLYYHQSQYLLRGEIDPTFIRFKERNAPGQNVLNMNKEGLRLPYRDTSFEYPPLAIIPILIPGLFTSELYSYRILFSQLASFAYFVALWIFLKICRDHFKNTFSKKYLRIVLASSLGFLILMGPIVVTRLDIYPALLLALALGAAQKDRVFVSGALLALGVATKLYPIVVTPLFIYYWLQKNPKSALRCSLGFATAFAIVYLPVMLLAPEGYFQSLSYHSDRGVEIESVYASVAQIFHVMGYPAEVYTRYGSKNIFFFGEEWVKQYWPLFCLLALGFGYLHALIQMRKKTFENGVENQSFFALVEGCFILILGLITFSKVLSVQYIVWFFPLFLMVGIRRKMIFPMTLQIALGTQLIYPYFFTDLVNLENGTIALLLWRNALLVLLFLALIDWKAFLQGLKSGLIWFSKRIPGRRPRTI